MSASILWKPTGGGNSLGVSTPSRFIETMKKAGFGFPCTLDAGDYNKLIGMGAVYDGEKDDNPYYKLADIVGDIGSIEVFAEY